MNLSRSVYRAQFSQLNYEPGLNYKFLKISYKPSNLYFLEAHFKKFVH